MTEFIDRITSLQRALSDEESQRQRDIEAATEDERKQKDKAHQDRLTVREKYGVRAAQLLLQYGVPTTGIWSSYAGEPEQGRAWPIYTEWTLMQDGYVGESFALLPSGTPIKFRHVTGGDALSVPRDGVIGLGELYDAAAEERLMRSEQFERGIASQLSGTGEYRHTNNGVYGISKRL